MTKGSLKGSEFEREISRMLSLWWSDGLKIDPPRDDLFWRTHGSGARAKTRARKGLTTEGQYGDVAATNPISKPLTDCCLIELKRGYSKSCSDCLNPLDVLDRRKGTPLLLRFWEQVFKDAYLVNRDPILIFKRDRREPCVMITNDFYYELYAYSNNTFRNYATLKGIIPHALDLRIKRLDDFLDWANPQYFVERSLLHAKNTDDASL